MITINSVSGGKTSSYLAKHYPADYNLFSLVRINGKQTITDKKVIQYIEDKIGMDFIATAEDDKIIKTMIDLEQYIGREIIWVSGETFDEHIIKNNGNVPNLMRRTCTIELKIKPMFNWWLENINEVVEMRIGFRANEIKRKLSTDQKLNKDGFLEMNHSFSKTISGRNKWTNVAWQKPRYPLIEDNLYKDQIQSYWKDKPVVFAPINNCVGCFHQNKLLLRKRFDWHPEKMEWFTSKEGYENIVRKSEKNKHNKNLFMAGQQHPLSYETIKKMGKQESLFDLKESDFNECDSGYCGL
jgi:hypothetical protein